MCIICLWAHLGPPKPTHVCNILAIWGLRGDFFNFFTIFSQDFVKMCFPQPWEAHFWKAAQSISHHFTSKNSCFGPLSDTKMRHFGHFRPPWNLKIRRKNEAHLFMSPLGPPPSPHMYATYLPFEACEAIFDDFYRFFKICWWFVIDFCKDVSLIF